MRTKLSAGAALLGGSLLLPLLHGHGQIFTPQQQSPFPQDREEDRNDPYRRQREEKLGLARNSQRQQQLVRDTERLVALANELKAEVSKSNKDTLSIGVVKKAEEIEKLAKSVKEKMRQ